ncbi:MAG: Piwi domain-containing protein [Bacteroidales bacterium]
MSQSQNLLINIIPFSLPVISAEFPFYKDKTEGYCPIHKGDLTGVIENHFSEEELEQFQWLYTNFGTPKENAIILNVDLSENIYFANHYHRFLIRSYFNEIAEVIDSNFTNEIEVWFKAPQQSNPKYTIYNLFTLKAQFARITDGPELVVSFDGTTKVLNKSLQDLTNFPTDQLNWVKCEKSIYRYKYMPIELKQDMDKIFPVVSNKLKPQFNIVFDKPTFDNRYPKYKRILDAFYNDYLNNESFRSYIPISEDGYMHVSAEKILTISEGSNQLLFGKDQKGEDTKRDVLRLGPHRTAKSNNVRFFFIYQQCDKKPYVENLYNYFTKGYKTKNDSGIEVQLFPDIGTFIKQPFYIEKADSISFDKLENAVETVDTALRNFKTLPDTQYIAIYVSPVSKAETNTNDHNIYYRIKELLLNYDFTSQVVYKNNILNKNFNYFLPNIEIAILAKLGGVPWRLNRSLSSEIIVGIGAFYSMSRKARFLGSAFCFNNEGIFENFDCFLSDDTDTLAGSIRKAVLKFLVDHEHAERLIIHFYKDISKKELTPIISTLNKLGLPIPVIIVTINKTESKELLAFDISDSNLMPYSGTIINVSKNEYLLFNNTRYTPASKVTNKEYHFPIKIAFTSSKLEILEDLELIRELTDQVYQFSRMYWKSIGQQSLPVTICYPEMVAKIFPNFESDTLPPFGQKNLWFL